MSITIECVAPTRSRISEGAVWDEQDQRLWWLDIPSGTIYRYDPVTGTNDSYDFGEQVGCLARRDNADGKGALVVASKNGFWFFDPETGTKTQIADPEAHLEHNRFNDGGCDMQGRFWAGTMKDGGGDPEQIGTFYRLDPDLSVTKWRGGIWTTNGLAFSPDGKTMYHGDSNAKVRTIWVSDYDTETGTPGPIRVFKDTSDLPGRPDGGTVDADGCYWQAGIDGWHLYRYSPEGEIIQTVDVPVERPSKPQFGGKDLDILFFTSLGIGLTEGTDQPEAGSLHAIYGLGIKGVPQPRFAG